MKSRRHKTKTPKSPERHVFKRHDQGEPKEWVGLDLVTWKCTRCGGLVFANIDLIPKPNMPVALLIDSDEGIRYMQKCNEAIMWKVTES